MLRYILTYLLFFLPSLYFINCITFFILTIIFICNGLLNKKSEGVKILILFSPWCRTVPNLSGADLVEDFDIPKPILEAALNYIEAKAGISDMLSSLI